VYAPVASKKKAYETKCFLRTSRMVFSQSLAVSVDVSKLHCA